MDRTPFQSKAATPFSFLDSTAFPQSQQRDPFNRNRTHLKSLTITPIQYDRNSGCHQHRLNSFNQDYRQNLYDHSNEVNRLSSNENQNVKPDIDTITLTNSDIDSLADRMQDLLRYSTKLSNKTSLKSEGITEKLTPVNSQQRVNLLPPNDRNDVLSDKPSTLFTLSSLPSMSNLSPVTSLDLTNNSPEFKKQPSFAPISFTTTGIDNASLLNNRKSDRSTSPVHQPQFSYSPPIQHHELFNTKETVNSNESKPSRNQSHNNPESIMLEADKILLRIQTLMNKAKPSNSGLNSLSNSCSSTSTTSISNGSTHSSFPTSDTIKPISPTRHDTLMHTTTTVDKSSPFIAEPKLLDMNANEISDTETEYYEPPPPSENNLHNSFNQTFNSHNGRSRHANYKLNRSSDNNNKVEANQRVTATTTSVNNSPTDHHNRRSSPHLTASNRASLMPNRTILEEEPHCLGQMRRDTSDLRRLHTDLLQFEQQYLKQQEKRRNKKLSAVTQSSEEAPQSNSKREQFGRAVSEASQSSKGKYTTATTTIVKSAAPESHQRTTTAVNNCERRLKTPTQSGRPFPRESGRKSSPSSAAAVSSDPLTAITSDNICKGGKTQLCSNQQAGHHSNERHVRFDHQHIAHQIDQIQSDNHRSHTVIKARRDKATLVTTQVATPAFDQEQNKPCECCLRLLKMNPREMNEQLVCTQMNQVRLDQNEYLPRRSKTANARLSEDESREDIQQQQQSNKQSVSVQTSIILERDDDHIKYAQFRSKSVAMGEYSLDCGYRGNRPGSIPRTPPPKKQHDRPTKPLAYFVALNGNEPKKKANTVSNRKLNNNQLSKVDQSTKPKVKPTSTVMPVPAHTLQDAFDRNMAQFKLRSLTRVRKIKDNEEMRIQTADQRKEEIAQMYWTKQGTDHDHRHVVTDRLQPSVPTGGDIQLMGTYNKKTANKKSSPRKNGSVRQMPLVTRRVFTHREMRAQTEKVYRKLPEAKAHTVTAKREDDARRRRLMADIFKQRLKENAIQGRLNWPITGQAITS